MLGKQLMEKLFTDKSKLNCSRSRLIFRQLAFTLCCLLTCGELAALTLLDEQIKFGNLTPDAWQISGVSGISGSAGQIQIKNSFSESQWKWDQNVIASTKSFDEHNLSIEANLTVGTGAYASLIMGIGDEKFSAGKSLSYLFRVNSSGAIETFDFKNGAYNSKSCSSNAKPTQGARYEMKLIPNGFHLYKNSEFLCTHTATFSLPKRKIFFQGGADLAPSIVSAILVKTNTPFVLAGAVENGVVNADAYQIFGPKAAVIAVQDTLKVKDSFDPNAWKWSQSGAKSRASYPMGQYPITLESSISVGLTATASKGRYALLGLGDHDFLTAGESADGSRKGVIAMFVSLDSVMLLHTGPAISTKVQYCGAYMANAHYRLVIDQGEVKLFVDGNPRCTANWNLTGFKAKPIIAQSSTDQTHSEFRQIKLSLPQSANEPIITSPQRKSIDKPWVATRDITLRNGLAQTIPHVQTQQELAIGLNLPNYAAFQEIRSTLRNQFGKAYGVVQAPNLRLTPYFENLEKGLYSLHVEGLTKANEWVSLDFVSGIGIGDIVFVLGDSITEGFWGDMFETAFENSAQAPWASRSRDNRNLPQYGPRTDVSPLAYKSSYLAATADAVGERLNYPVFLYNWGVGSYTSANVTALVGTDFFASQAAVLKPSKYFVGIGINDANAGVSSAQFDAELRLLRKEISRHSPSVPTYLARFSPASAAWNSCCSQMNQLAPSLLQTVDNLTANATYLRGPDLWSYFAPRLDSITSDGLHPNPLGMKALGRLWADAIWP
jgi:lysophospholipase L1-like esterase